MPSLRVFAIWESPITLRLHSTFDHIPLLDSLNFNNCRGPNLDVADDFVEAPVTLPLQG
jgi:hypothetical protein